MAGHRREGVADRPPPRRHGRRAAGGDLSVPTAKLLLITRNTGDVADEVDPRSPDDGRWYGPAAFDAYSAVESDAETP